MDLATIHSLRSHLASSRPDQALEHLVRFLSTDAGHALHSREARDRFASVLRQVRKGKIQLIGTEPRNQVVLITAKDLCDLLLSLQEQRPFMEGLRAMRGYDPPKKRLTFAERPRSRESISTPSLRKPHK